MSTVFTKLYDSPAVTRAVAASVIPTQVRDGSAAGYLTQDQLVPSRALTGIGVLHGGTVATDKMIVSLYDSAGALLANSATAGVLMAGTNAFQEYPFTAPYTIVKPGRFWIGAQTNGANANIRTIATATWIDVLATNVAGTFATIPALTPPTTFTAGKGPVAYAY